MVADQRYCVDCGHRRGESRLPSADAAASTGSAAVRKPPPPPRHGGSRSLWNPNAATLIAGVATLVLAVGLGFQIGRAGHEVGSSADRGTHITIENGGEAPVGPPEGRSEEPGPESSVQPGHKGGRESPGDGPAKAEPLEAEVESKSAQEAEAEAERKTKEALHAKGPPAKPKAQPGETCEPGTPGCGKDRKFNGVFFGSEG
jgi:hypothetical protein